jgi:hypothetical protein
MANPTFRAMLAEAKASATLGAGVSQEELERRLGPLTDVERAFADAYLAALDLLEEEQVSEVTDDQGRLLRLVLVGAEYARGQTDLAQLAEDSGCAGADIRAVAAALRAARLVGSPAAP